MITREELKAFLDQQIAEKGKMPLMIEAMQWAKETNMMPSRLWQMPKEMQQKQIFRLMLMYVRTLM